MRHTAKRRHYATMPAPAPAGAWTPIPAGAPLIAGREDVADGFITSRPAGSSDHQIMLTLTGSGRYDGDPDFSTQAGDVIIIQPGTGQQYRVCPAAGSWAYLWVHLHLPVQDIASAVGFDSPFYFSQRFSHAYGSSPRAWRRRFDGTIL